MHLLKFLESIRNPVLDAFFSLITHFGAETVFIIVGIAVFWCLNKKHGYYILTVGFLGIVANSFLKMLFRVPRPWVKDPNFTIVESARAEATGYSFPSGHTQVSVGLFGVIAKVYKKWVRVLAVALCVLIPLSRLYLGVHTFLDVSVSVLIALALIFLVHPLIEKAFEKPKLMRVLFLIMALFSLSFILFMHFFPFPSDTDSVNYLDAVENSYKMFGCILGLMVSFEIDTKFTRFETKAVWWAQILKVVLGLIPILLIKSLLKEPLLALFNGGNLAGCVRYFLITFFAGGIWPITFKWFSKAK